MKLFICEKPSQAKDIGKVLGLVQENPYYLEGENIKITWCQGHMLQQARPIAYCKNLQPWRKSVLPVIPTIWQLLPKAKAKDQLNEIKKLLKEADSVVIATDADREGELIAREILDYYDYKGPIERLWLSALDKISIEFALSNIRNGESTYALYQSALARQRADWLFGMNLTMMTTCTYGKHGEAVLSVGRVQTPTLNLIVGRDRQIENFKSHFFYPLSVDVLANRQSFKALWLVPEDYQDDNGKCRDLDYVTAIANKVRNQKAVIKDVTEIYKTVTAPLSLSLSELQKLASSQYGMSASDTSEYAQKLYDNKLITYPRTDCPYLPVSQFKDAEKVLQAVARTSETFAELVESCDPTIKTKVWNDKKISAHHAIIPLAFDNLQCVEYLKRHKKINLVYELIARHYVAQFFKHHKFTEHTVIVNCKHETFTHKTNITTTMGWKTVFQKSTADETNLDEIKNPPQVTKGMDAVIDEATVEKKATKPPPRFTHGTLIAAMKNIANFVSNPEQKAKLKKSSGIGTEATRASIIEILFNRGYIEINKNKIISTERGKKLIDLLPNQIKDPGMTAVWEDVLDGIAVGEESIDTFLHDQTITLDFMLEDIQDEYLDKAKIKDVEIYPCPSCRVQLIQKHKKNGDVFWGCESYPECKTSFADKEGKPDFKEIPKTSHLTCPKCHEGKLLRRKSQKAKKYWWGCSKFPGCNASFIDKKGKPLLKA